MRSRPGRPMERLVPPQHALGVAWRVEATRSSDETPKEATMGPIARAELALAELELVLERYQLHSEIDSPELDRLLARTSHSLVDCDTINLDGYSAEEETDETNS